VLVLFHRDALPWMLVRASIRDRGDEGNVFTARKPGAERLGRKEAGGASSPPSDHAEAPSGFHSLDGPLKD